MSKDNAASLGHGGSQVRIMCYSSVSRGTILELTVESCHRPAYRSQGVIGVLEPADDRRNEARA